jgi:hypothetical protein
MSRQANLYPAPNEMQLGVIRAAWPTAAWQNKATALTANWMFARGTPLVVDGGHAWVEAGAQTRELNYRCQVDDVHSNLAFAITCSTIPQEGASFLPAEIAGYALAISTEPKVIQIPFLNLTGNGEISLQPTFVWDGDQGALLIHQLIVYECPAVSIANTGVEVIERGDMIWDGYDDRQSIAGLERAVNDLRDNYFRKGALLNWTTGYSGGVTTTETSYQDLHPNGIRPAIQTRMMYEGETLRDVSCNVYAVVSGGTGNVRLTMTNGDVRTFAITNTSPDWQTTESLQVETEDPSYWGINGGVRGGSRDEITIEYRAGAGESISLYGVSIWDPPGD